MINLPRGSVVAPKGGQEMKKGDRLCENTEEENHQWPFVHVPPSYVILLSTFPKEFKVLDLSILLSPKPTSSIYRQFSVYKTHRLIQKQRNTKSDFSENLVATIKLEKQEPESRSVAVLWQTRRAS